MIEYISSVEIAKNRSTIQELLLTINREGIQSLVNYLNTTTFYVDPASSRYHNNFEGGLALHSLNVYSCLRDISANGRVDITEENKIITAICHDLCKIGTYKISKRNRKTFGQWESYEIWESQVNKDNLPLGHCHTSIDIAERFIKLEPIEKVMIANHMGMVDVGYSRRLEISEAYTIYPQAAALHIADMMATYLYENVIAT